MADTKKLKKMEGFGYPEEVGKLRSATNKNKGKVLRTNDQATLVKGTVERVAAVPEISRGGRIRRWLYLNRWPLLIGVGSIVALAVPVLLGGIAAAATIPAALNIGRGIFFGVILGVGAITGIRRVLIARSNLKIFKRHRAFRSEVKLRKMNKDFLSKKTKFWHKEQALNTQIKKYNVLYSEYLNRSGKLSKASFNDALKTRGKITTLLASQTKLADKIHKLSEFEIPKQIDRYNENAVSKKEYARIDAAGLLVDSNNSQYATTLREEVKIIESKKDKYRNYDLDYKNVDYRTASRQYDTLEKLHDQDATLQKRALIRNDIKKGNTLITDRQAKVLDKSFQSANRFISEHVGAYQKDLSNLNFVEDKNELFYERDRRVRTLDEYDKNDNLQTKVGKDKKHPHFDNFDTYYDYYTSDDFASKDSEKTILQTRAPNFEKAIIEEEIIKENHNKVKDHTEEQELTDHSPYMSNFSPYQHDNDQSVYKTSTVGKKIKESVDGYGLSKQQLDAIEQAAMDAEMEDITNAEMKVKEKKVDSEYIHEETISQPHAETKMDVDKYINKSNWIENNVFINKNMIGSGRPINDSTNETAYWSGFDSKYKANIVSNIKENPTINRIVIGAQGDHMGNLASMPHLDVSKEYKIFVSKIADNDFITIAGDGDDFTQISIDKNGKVSAFGSLITDEFSSKLKDKQIRITKANRQKLEKSSFSAEYAKIKKDDKSMTDNFFEYLSTLSKQGQKEAFADASAHINVYVKQKEEQQQKEQPQKDTFANASAHINVYVKQEEEQQQREQPQKLEEEQQQQQKEQPQKLEEDHGKER